MPKINQEEYGILKSLDDKWKWIARDDDLSVYDDKPVKAHSVIPCWDIRKTKNEWEIINRNLFQFIQWEDEEPYNIAELIEEYEYSTEHVSHVVNERLKALGKAWSESEETEVKNIEELKSWFEDDKYYAGEYVNHKIDQLDEPEVLSQEWIDGHAVRKIDGRENPLIVYVDDLQNLLVPKQEEVDQAYKDGYEKGKQHTFYKGYLEGLEDKGSEPETVADVLTTFWKSYERLKEVMNMEVEELEE